MKLYQFSSLLAVAIASSALAENQLICEVELRDPAPEAPMRCGSVMSPTNTKHMIQRSAMFSTEHRCAAACWMDMKCLSFTWEASAGVCKTFSATGKTMKLRKSVDGATKYWNKSCYKCNPKKFYLKTESKSPMYNNKYVQVPVGKADKGRGAFADTPTDYFKMYQNGVVTVDELGLNSYMNYDGSAGPGTNSYRSTFFFLNPDNLVQEKEPSHTIPINCHIHHENMSFTCASDGGSTFFGCTDPDAEMGESGHFDAQGLMLAPSGATNQYLQSANCAPLTMYVEFL